MGGVLSCLALNVCECACCCACSCCKSIFNATMAQASRIGHLLILVALFAFAVILGQSSPGGVNQYNDYSGIKLDENCGGHYENECIYRQLVYRASFTLFLLFAILALASTISEYVNRSFWVLKIAFAFLIFFAFWWGDNSFFSGWAQFARFFSFAFLLVQALLLLDFAYDCHEVIMFNADEAAKTDGGGKYWLGFYLFLCIGFITLSFVGVGYLYSDYSGCDAGATFTSITLIFGVLTTIISVLNNVNKGLLTPSIMFAYSAFMCWYSLLSSPDEECNPDASTNDGKKEDSMIIISVVTAIILLYCVVNGSLILNIFNPEGEGVMVGQQSSMPQLSGALSPSTGVTTTQPVNTDSPGSSDEGEGLTKESSGTAHERVFFHVLMMLAACYGAMMLTNWGKMNGEPEGEGSDKTPLMSMWLKITSQWVFLLMQCRVLYVAYQDNSS